MAGDLVLIAGATGHIGFRTLLMALQKGYKVRAAVRSQAKADSLLNNKVLKALNSHLQQLNFIIVPDLTTSGAYDDAVKDVRYIIHVASPLPTSGNVVPEKYYEYFVKPALAGTIGMLESAAKSSSVKRVVITSSVVALISFNDLTSPTFSATINADNRTPFVEGPYSSEIEAYGASKIAAFNEAEAWVAQKKPAFDLVHIHPSFVEGRDDLVTTAEAAVSGTNAIILAYILGKKDNAFQGASVHNEDVARTHVDALNTERIPGNTSYISHSNNPAGALNGTNWEDATEIVARLFPEAVKKGIIPNDGTGKSLPYRMDASKTETTFGFTHLSFEEQVKSVVGHYLELLGHNE